MDSHILIGYEACAQGDQGFVDLLFLCWVEAHVGRYAWDVVLYAQELESLVGTFAGHVGGRILQRLTGGDAGELSKLFRHVWWR